MEFQNPLVTRYGIVKMEYFDGWMNGLIVKGFDSLQKFDASLNLLHSYKIDNFNVSALYRLSGKHHHANFYLDDD